MTKDDVIIIGSGIAALQLATQLNNQLNVRILTKGKLRTANSYLAQGGIAAAIGTNDHPSKHTVDTLEAGRFHNDQEVVREIINAAPTLIRNMSLEGDVFDKNPNGELFLGMEGAHSEKRIVHGGGDATGKNMMEHLITKLQANVIIEEDVFAYELILNSDQTTCIGVKAKQADDTIKSFYGSHIIIASGGCGQLFTYTSNAETVCGDGIAMAYLAGAEIVDMEFIQFHPTLLYVNGETKGLISEAVRGEGAILITDDETPIMTGIHPMKDLAPRHVVSQRIYEFLRNGKQVYLDIRNIKDFTKRFPSITTICVENGIRIEDGKIPVAPGSHFLMGGIKTDLIGRSSIRGLYAIGEAACTGLHGANRLASNSLLEGLYQGEQLSKWINGTRAAHQESKISDSLQPAISKHLNLPDRQLIQETMMERVGIVRNKEDLKKQQTWLTQFNADKIPLDHCSVHDLSRIFMVITASLITESALQRTESRGGHFRSDYPVENDQHWLRRSIIHKYNRGMEKNHEFIKTALAT
ncbi:L-aspartate oxidase [Neobacillus cucumis]|uniref:L-aspartate oxidase n=1 Tax=Neobacillus cucumis TaxID=1740721 RepID=UPI00285347FE|nr:L-aspartate oxidase [Neobacillus cucumis]MDR4948727.1 L-aspartate oxidase [Neobacillus cucumis]